MGIAMAFGLILIALAIISVILWGAVEALIRLVRFCGNILWKFGDEEKNRAVRPGYINRR